MSSTSPYKDQLNKVSHNKKTKRKINRRRERKPSVLKAAEEEATLIGRIYMDLEEVIKIVSADSDTVYTTTTQEAHRLVARNPKKVGLKLGRRRRLPCLQKRLLTSRRQSR